MLFSSSIKINIFRLFYHTLKLLFFREILLNKFSRCLSINSHKITKERIGAKRLFIVFLQFSFTFKRNISTIALIKGNLATKSNQVTGHP